MAQKAKAVLGRITGAIGLAVTCAATQAAVIDFTGTSVGSVGLGQREPFYNAFYSFVYVDGVNHAPRVDPSAYGGTWTPQHGATSTSLSGWSSLDNGAPGRYAFDTEGLALDSETMVTSGPRYGHNDRVYTGGTWSLIDLNNSAVVASGTFGTTLMDVNYAGVAPYGMTGTSTLQVNDDGGAFYNELASKTLLLSFACYDTPGVHLNAADLANGWATYGNSTFTLTSQVPEPSTLLLGGLGLAALAAFRAKRKS